MSSEPPLTANSLTTNLVTASLVRRAGSWIALCFAWSWGVAAVVYFADVPVEGYWSLALAVPFLVGPLLASLVWKRFVVREPVASLDTGLRFDGIVLLSWLGPVLVVWASALVAHLFGWGTLDLTGGPIVERVLAVRGADAAAKVQEGLAASQVPYAVLASVQALIVGLFFYTPLAFAEEIGWRGVLLRELRPLGFWPAALGIGVLWGLWHVPLVLSLGYFPDAPVEGTLVLVGASIPLSARSWRGSGRPPAPSGPRRSRTACSRRSGASTSSSSPAACPRWSASPGSRAASCSSRSPWSSSPGFPPGPPAPGRRNRRWRSDARARHRVLL